MKKSTLFNILFGVWLGFSLSVFDISFTTLGFWVILIPTIILAQKRIYYHLKEQRDYLEKEICNY